MRRTRPRDPTRSRDSRIVVIADDDETMRIVLQRAFDLAGLLALPVADGGEIWPILERERERVRALVLDLNMNGVNGWEVLRRLRDEVHRGLRQQTFPVIVLSAQGDKETREFTLGLGADAFFSKPVDLDRIIAAVRAHA